MEAIERSLRPAAASALTKLPPPHTILYSLNKYFVLKTVMGCCDILNKVIDPVRKTMPTATWPELIAKCYENGLDLSAKYM